MEELPLVAEITETHIELTVINQPTGDIKSGYIRANGCLKAVGWTREERSESGYERSWGDTYKFLIDGTWYTFFEASFDVIPSGGSIEATIYCFPVTGYTQVAEPILKEDYLEPEKIKITEPSSRCYVKGLFLVPVVGKKDEFRRIGCFSANGSEAALMLWETPEGWVCFKEHESRVNRSGGPPLEHDRPEDNIPLWKMRAKRQITII